MKIERFDSVESYSRLALAKSLNKNNRNINRANNYGYSFNSHNSNPYFCKSQGKEWDNGLSFQEAVSRGEKGDPGLVSSYIKDVDRLVNEFNFRDDFKNKYVSSVAGSRVSIPDYLFGSPRSMKRRAPQETTVRSVNIYVGLVCAAGIKAEQMLKRGSTILALLEFLQMSQISVELYLLVETHGETDGDLIQIINVQSHPLDLSTAGFAVAHPAFTRHVTYGMAYELDQFNGMWGSSHGIHGNSTYQDKLAKAIGMGENDIYIPPPVISDELIFKNPEAWLAQKIEKIRGVIS